MNQSIITSGGLLMNGITILNSTEVVAKTALIWDTKCTISLCVMLAGLFLLIRMLLASDKWIEQFFSVFYGIGCALFTLGLLFTIIFYKTENPIAYKMQYQVTIDDSVLLNEFLEKYNIISIDGKIYTIEEKN